MLATEIKGNSIRVKIMLYFFALTVGFLSQITSVMSQSVSVDYCVLEKLGSAPNVPSTLLGKAPSTNNIKNCATKIKRKPPYGANTQLYLSRPDKTSRNKTQRAPRFPIIKNGQFIPPAGQIGLTALNKQQDLSLLSPPARKDELTPRKRVSQFSKYAAANKKILNAKVPVRKIKTPSAISKLKKAGIRVVGADMNGQSLFETDLRGPIAIVMGGESKGLSPTLQKKCDAIVSIPLHNRVESLNVSVSAGIVLYEKIRQEGT